MKFTDRFQKVKEGFGMGLGKYFEDNVPRLRGELSIIVKKNGIIIHEEKKKNQILNKARESMSWLCHHNDYSPDPTLDRRVRYLWLGTGGLIGSGSGVTPNPPSPADTWLETPIPVGSDLNPKEIDIYDHGSASNEVIFEAYVDKAMFNGYFISEALLSGEYSGTVSDYPWARQTFLPIPKGEDLTINFLWKFIF